MIRGATPQVWVSEPCRYYQILDFGFSSKVLMYLKGPDGLTLDDLKEKFCLEMALPEGCAWNDPKDLEAQKCINRMILKYGGVQDSSMKGNLLFYLKLHGFEEVQEKPESFATESLLWFLGSPENK